MKKMLAVLMAIMMLLSVLPAMAESVLPWEGEAIQYEGFTADLGFTEDPEKLVMKAYQEDLGNVSIKWSLVPMSDLATKVNVYMNSGDIPDIIWTDEPTARVRDYGDMGGFLDLNKYTEYMPNLQGYKEDYGFLKSLETEDGALYCIVDISPHDGISETWRINKTALDALEMEIPETWDEMLAVMKAYKAANPDGLGIITYNWGLSHYLYTLAQVTGTSYEEWQYSEDKGEWINGIMDESSGFKDLIGMMAELYAEGLIHPEFSTISSDALDQYIVSGNWLFGYWYEGTPVNKFGEGGVPFELDSMLTPSLTADAPHYANLSYRYDAMGGWAYFASSDVAQPEVMASVMDYFISPEASELFYWGLEGTSFEYDANGARVYLEDYATNTDRRSELGIGEVQGIRCISLGDSHSTFSTNPVSTQKALATVSQALIDGSCKAVLTSHGAPMFTAEESETISYSATPMKTYADEQLLLFVDGTRSMDEWDAFVEEYKAMGNPDEVLGIYNNAAQQVFSTDRKIPLYTYTEAE